MDITKELIEKIHSKLFSKCLDYMTTSGHINRCWNCGGEGTTYMLFERTHATLMCRKCETTRLYNISTTEHAEVICVEYGGK